ncbi:MAG: hypothetical protein WDO15_06165 [Bacteroidota bacterium]
MNYNPLYELFMELRKEKLSSPLTLEDYYLLLKFLTSDYPVENFDELSFAVITIWSKSYDDGKKMTAVLQRHRRRLSEFFEESIEELKFIIDNPAIKIVDDYKETVDDKPTVKEEIEIPPTEEKKESASSGCR